MRLFTLVTQASPDRGSAETHAMRLYLREFVLGEKARRVTCVSSPAES